MADYRRVVAAAAVGMALALGACGTRQADPAPAAGAPSGGRRAASIPVQAVAVQSGPLATEHESAGSIVPVTLSQVAAQVSGIVARLPRQAGDWVAAGETVVQIDDAQLQLAVANARAALQTARINLTVAQDTASQSDPRLALQAQSAESSLSAVQRNYDALAALYKLGGASPSQVDNARSQLEQARANLEAARFALDQNRKADTQNVAQLKLAVEVAGNQLGQAELNLQNASVKAPFAGQIAAVSVSPGMFVGQNTPAFVLVSAGRQISFGVPPSDAPSLPQGSLVHFLYQGRSYDVRVRQAPSAPVNGIVPMIAEAPPDPSLAFGTVGTVAYTLTLARGIIVPVAALQTSENQDFVFAVVDGAAMVRRVTILAEAGTSAVANGLEPGTQVVVNPPPGLLAGSSVRAVGPAGEAGPAGGGGGGGGAGPAKAPAGGPPRAGRGTRP